MDRFDSLYGSLIRFVDEAARHFGCHMGTDHTAALNGFAAIITSYNRMRQRAAA